MVSFATSAFANDALVSFFRPVQQASYDQGFTTKYEFRLVKGLIWYRDRGAVTEWKKFAGTGLAPLDFNGFPANLVRISVDGGILYAFNSSGRIFDAKINDGSLKTVEWSSKWGWPMRLYAFAAFVNFPYRDLAGSYLDGEYARIYQDRAGNSHNVKGVMTLYVLNKKGNAIHFNDPWLPPNHFEARFSTPDRGRVEALAIAAAGSTVMIIDADANVYTRMIDFDTLGGNPGIGYTFEEKNFNYSSTGFGAWCRNNLPWVDTRVLPTNDWVLQPKIKLKPGIFVTTRLTIFQNGIGNDAREMRVEGIDEEGNRGYYRKSVSPDDVNWTFIQTDEALRGGTLKHVLPFLERTETEEGFSFFGPHDQILTGTATFYDEGASVVPGMTPGRVKKGEVHLNGWNLSFDPIVVALVFKEGKQSYTFYALLHLMPGIFPFRQHGENLISGRLVLQRREERLRLVPPLFRTRISELLDITFKHRTDLPVIVKTSKNSVRIEVDTLKMPNQSAAVFQLTLPENLRR